MSIFSSLSEKYDQIWQYFIRPPRIKYSEEDLGPSSYSLYETDTQVVRTSFDIPHKKYVLKTSLYTPGENATKSLLIYLHSHSGSQLEGKGLVDVLLPHGTCLCTFDFGGAGRSTGKYISLGYKEHKELKTVLNYLISTYKFEKISIYGKSMGAVAALLLIGKNPEMFPQIETLIQDSPFARLEDVVSNIVEKNASKIPKQFINGFVHILNSSIKERANFSIFDLNPIEYVDEIEQKCIFVKGELDDLIKDKEFDELVYEYSGEKSVFTIKGSTHSEQRLPVTEPLKEAFISLVTKGVLLTEEQSIKINEERILKEKKLEHENYTASGSTNAQAFTLANINSKFMKTFNSTISSESEALKWKRTRQRSYYDAYSLNGKVIHNNFSVLKEVNGLTKVDDKGGRKTPQYNTDSVRQSLAGLVNLSVIKKEGEQGNIDSIKNHKAIKRSNKINISMTKRDIQTEINDSKKNNSTNISMEKRTSITHHAKNLNEIIQETGVKIVPNDYHTRKLSLNLDHYAKDMKLFGSDNQKLNQTFQKQNSSSKFDLSNQNCQNHIISSDNNNGIRRSDKKIINNYLDNKFTNSYSGKNPMSEKILDQAKNKNSISYQDFSRKKLSSKNLENVIKTKVVIKPNENLFSKATNNSFAVFSNNPGEENNFTFFKSNSHRAGNGKFNKNIISNNLTPKAEQTIIESSRMSTTNKFDVSTTNNTSEGFIYDDSMNTNKMRTESNEVYGKVYFSGTKNQPPLNTGKSNSKGMPSRNLITNPKSISQNLKSIIQMQKNNGNTKNEYYEPTKNISNRYFIPSQSVNTNVNGHFIMNMNGQGNNSKQNNSQSYENTSGSNLNYETTNEGSNTQTTLLSAKNYGTNQRVLATSIKQNVHNQHQNSFSKNPTKVEVQKNPVSSKENQAIVNQSNPRESSFNPKENIGLVYERKNSDKNLYSQTFSNMNYGYNSKVSDNKNNLGNIKSFSRFIKPNFVENSTKKGNNQIIQKVNGNYLFQNVNDEHSS